MKSRTPILLFLVAAASALLAGRADAQTPGGAVAPAAKAQAADEFTRGEVRKVDREGRKITLKHEEIRNLGMPPMAMVFQVKDASVLDKFKPGDPVQFRAAYEGGKYIVIDIRPAR